MYVRFYILRFRGRNKFTPCQNRQKTAKNLQFQVISQPDQAKMIKTHQNYQTSLGYYLASKEHCMKFVLL